MKPTLLLLSVVAAVWAAPAPAQSTCVWGCHCEGSSCGCNSRGSGGSCDTGGSGCVVTKCGTEEVLRLAPDGSVVRLASSPAARRAAPRPAAPEPTAAHPQVRARWEYVALGRSVARHCTGVVIAHYYAPPVAAALRARQGSISI
jgi:hypothetical protein